MIGYAFTSKPKQSGRDVLDDILIPKKLPAPVSGESWWMTARREGFTALASRLFLARQPRSTDDQVKSNWDKQ